MLAKAQTMVLASFAADSLALAAHWVYDTRQIDQRFGRLTELRAPSPPTYHPTKEAGEFTHYGDQTLLLLRSVAEAGGFDAAHFSAAWHRFFETYRGYVDGASRQTLQKLDAGTRPEQAGSASTDLAGAARIAPLVYCYRNQPQRLAESARQQTALTHNTAEVLASAEFFSRTAWLVLQGLRPVEAMIQAAAEAPADAPAAGWFQAGLASAARESRSAIRSFGQMCEAPAAFPATVHLIARYEERLEEALVENATAGGDSAGRGLLVGMVLGAHGGPAALPERWLKAMKATAEIKSLLSILEPR